MKTIRRSEAYVNFIRKQECCVTGHRVAGEVCAHHVRMGANAGIGIKPSDFRCVPLCNEAHQKLHQYGERDFWDKAKVDPIKMIIHYIFKFADEKNINPNHLIMALETAIIEQLELGAHATRSEGVEA